MWANQPPPTRYQISVTGGIREAHGEFDPETGEQLFYVTVEVKCQGIDHPGGSETDTRTFREYPPMVGELALHAAVVTAEWYGGVIGRLLKRITENVNERDGGDNVQATH